MAAAILLCVALTWLGRPIASQAPEDWSKTAEASFMTAEERRAWGRLDSPAARDDFKRAYWQRRDPTPGTERNEFQEEVVARVRVADERFGSPTQAGSQTARGLVYVVLGPPAVIRGTGGPLDTRPRTEFPGRSTLPRTALDTTTWEEWVYEGEHNRELLKIVGRPFVEIAFVVERGRDQIQRAGVFAGYREAVARRSIVRP
jgi:GWxTD domain-containing protein